MHFTNPVKRHHWFSDYTSWGKSAEGWSPAALVLTHGSARISCMSLPTLAFPTLTNDTSLKVGKRSNFSNIKMWSAGSDFKRPRGCKSRLSQDMLKHEQHWKWMKCGNTELLRVTKKKWPTEMCVCVKQLVQICIWAIWIFHLIAKLPFSSSVTPRFFDRSYECSSSCWPSNPLVSRSHVLILEIISYN